MLLLIIKLIFFCFLILTFCRKMFFNEQKIYKFIAFPVFLIHNKKNLEQKKAFFRLFKVLRKLLKKLPETKKMEISFNF